MTSSVHRSLREERTNQPNLNLLERLLFKMKLSDVSFATPIEILSLTPTTVAIVIATVGEEMINKVLTLKVNFFKYNTKPIIK